MKNINKWANSLLVWFENFIMVDYIRGKIIHNLAELCVYPIHKS